ncbi:hypothetical protein LHJ74_30745 [Streptomyces sp. N2-109]|uniref:Uncharacterized protein n=1 Tax=Streptomyces gossypii TaxID=2883101 RepID=A0ABT2K3Z2_9ACTN|nr:hypothetical protein [Streptomyces gossypii]MCT2594235.1 hypothetical protein [Streptomyces gossypii]
MTDRIRAALTYAREHKALVTSVAVAVVSLAEQWVPGFPADDVLRALASVLGA